MGARILSVNPALQRSVKMKAGSLGGIGKSGETMVWKYVLLAAGLALAPMAAEAQSSLSYRCVGNDGKKYYGSIIPPACAGRVVEQLSPQGQVVRRIDPEGDEKQRAAKEAEAVKKREQAAIANETARRNRALLATYTSEKDIEEARRRTLVENEKAIKDVEGRIGDIKKRQATYEKEMEFYKEGAPKAAEKGKPKGAAKPPAKLLEDMKNAEVDLQAHENLLAAKRKEVEGVNAKYDEDKRRFSELTKRK
jgi:hypothetical protein